MRKTHINNFVKGWFIGNFEPTLNKTKYFEAAIQTYKKGQREPKHHHKIATEYTVIVVGKVSMNGDTYNAGDIIIINPGESTDFVALEDAVTSVVKMPCVKGDKYLDE